ncbi:MAG: hypothetical protein EBR49_03815 [Betaproteobacteria bacterium]|nr:hypothetical protein [Betaproteobacteria bacterium]
MGNMVKREVLFVDGEGGAWPWRRQMREPEGIWGSTHYTFAVDSTSKFDWLVVFSAWPEVPLNTSVPRARRIFVAGEPESFHRYQSRFLEQFGTVITTQRGTQHAGAIHDQPAINWFAGVRFQDGVQRLAPMLNFSDFEAGNPVKTKLCSVVCSTNATTKGHRQRMAFVDLLERELGDRIDFYGRGRRDVSDKDEALADYRFHIALENSVHRDYWTEKLADPFLRGCYPIYYGCPNLEDYFPQGSFSRIDISRPREALATVSAMLEGDEDLRHAAQLGEAKRRILYEYNIFAVLEKLFPRLEAGLQPRYGAPSEVFERQRLYSDHEAKDFKLSRRMRRWLRSWV